jgi:uncharacterized membrane protein YjgN (DUF898 family)
MDQPAPLSVSHSVGPGATTGKSIPFRFVGTSSEYFRIWIVNLLLTVLTLGVYSAWAKVRRKQYFYRNTLVSDTSFEYLADPIPILKGRLIIAAVLGLVAVSQYVSLWLYAAMIVFMILATPWVLVKALSFNARNSAYRNVRFAFRGTTGESYRTYFIAMAAYVFTLGLGFPYMQWRMSQFVVTGHRYGNLSSRFRSKVGPYFKAFLIAVGGTFAFFVLLGIVVGASGVLTGAVPEAGGSAEPNPPSPAFFMGLLAVYAFMIVPAAYLKAKIANLFWGGIDIGPHRLESTQTFKEVLALLVTNLLGVAFSLGLAIPWAVIRSYRYRVNHVTIHTSGPLVVDADDQHDNPQAFGDAATDLGDFDFDFG